jgi:S1-C subfamily serine protease
MMLMIHHRKKSVPLLISLTILGIVVALEDIATAVCDIDFTPPTLSKDSLQEKEGAVLLLRSGICNEGPPPEECKGTGYLIDSSQGYVLTAYHVVKRSIIDPSIPIYATSPALLGEDLRLYHIANLHDLGVDMALLQLERTDKLRHVDALNFSLRRLKRSDPIYVMGYPRGEDTVKSKEVQYIGRYATDKSLLEVQQAAFPGESGSPLIDTTGTVVATALQRLNTTTALYIPVIYSVSLLTKIPIRDSVSILDKRIREEEIAKKNEWLVQQLRHKTMSSSDLVSWAIYISASPADKYKKTVILLIAQFSKLMTIEA